MAESASASTSSSPEMPINREEASSSSSTSQVRQVEEGNNRNYEYGGQPFTFRNPELEEHNQNQHIDDTYTANNFLAFDGAPNVIRDDTWSCIIVVLTFWFFVSMTLILGVYGAVSLQLGPNSSILIEPNPIFVESVKVEELDDTKPSPTVYGFYKTPPLDDVANWLETHNVSVNADSHMEWIHYLNGGSQINISYSVTSPGSSIFLIIAEGNEGLSQWLQDPTYPNLTLSWNVVHGSGMIQQDIYRSSSYYVALGNLNSEMVKVELNITIKASLYNTTEAYNKCSCANGACSLSVLFPEGTSIVLTSPGLGQGTTGDGWLVKVSYGPRWLTYIVGVGAMTAVMLVVFKFLNKFQCTREVDTGVQHGEMGSERAPLLTYKDDDLSSWGSSYDSVSNDEEDLEDLLLAEGKSIKDGENSNNTRRLCAICFDAPRDCFFLPCGHCVACFACGTRIAQAAGTCPICRRHIKKVRKIFTV